VLHKEFYSFDEILVCRFSQSKQASLRSSLFSIFPDAVRSVPMSISGKQRRKVRLSHQMADPKLKPSPARQIWAI